MPYRVRGSFYRKKTLVRVYIIGIFQEMSKPDIYNARIWICLSEEYITVEMQMCLPEEIFIEFSYKTCCQDPDLLPKSVNTECLDVSTWIYYLKASASSIRCQDSNLHVYRDILQVLYSVSIRICLPEEERHCRDPDLTTWRDSRRLRAL
jgi:hypothetical protein